MQTSIYKGLKKQQEKSTYTEDFLVVEAPLEIQINNKAFTVVMRTPGNDDDLVKGLLFAENIYKDISDIAIEIIETNKNSFVKVNVAISDDKLEKGYLNKRSLLSVSSCGICGKQELEDFNSSKPALKNNTRLDIKKLPALFQIMRDKQRTFDLTGGSHAAVLFDKNYKYLTLKEDIGRHNAVDKCIGNLLASNKLKEAKFMLVSGRVSYEIITKAFFAKINTIVAVSACSSLAVDYAKEFGICLVGFSRDGKSTVYAHPENVV
ncbi:formate dehydrogenase accessory sulfurtransferase FdhD [Bacteroidota bacterium]